MVDGQPRSAHTGAALAVHYQGAPTGGSRRTDTAGATPPVLVYRFGRFELNPVARRLERDGRAVPLQPRPFDLLLYLLEHRDRVVPREEILERVWDVNVGPQALGVALHAIRRALEDDGESQVFLRTVRGSGIHFAAPVVSAPSPLTEDRLRHREGALPLLGREALMAEAQAALHEVEQGAGRLLLLHGEAGIGKSHAIEHLAALAVRRGFQVFGGRCAKGDAPGAFLPWRQIAQEITRGQTAEELAESLGVSPPEVSWLSRDFEFRKPDREDQDWLSQGARYRLFDLLVTLLARTAAERPLFLSIDDVHGADAGSMALLRHVLERLVELPVMLVASYRDVDREAIGWLERGVEGQPPGSTRSVMLRGISHPEICTLFESLVGVRIREDLARALEERTRGNPFFLTALSRVLGAEEGLDQLGPDDLERLALPKQVQEAVLLQLQDLTDDTLEALQLASLVGQEFLAADLESAMDLGNQELAARLEPAIRTHVLRLGESPGHYSFVHLLVRDVIVAALDDRTLWSLHARLAQGIERQVAGREWLRASELAHHYLQAIPITGPTPAIDYLEMAADWASEGMGYEDAAKYLEAALKLQPSGTPDRIAALLTNLGSALLQLGRRGESRDRFLLAAKIARRARLPRHLADVALQYAPDFIAVETGVVDHEHISLLNESLCSRREIGTRVEAQLVARLGVALHWSDEAHERAIEMAKTASPLARATGDSKTIAYTEVSAAFACFAIDKPKALLALDPYQIGRSDSLGALVSRVLRVTGHWLLGDMGSLRTEIEEFAGESRRVRVPRAGWYASLWRSALAFMEGRFDQGVRHQAEYLAMGESSSDRNVVHSQILQRFLVSIDCGGIEGFEDGLDYMVDAYPLVGWRAGKLLYLTEMGRLGDSLDLLRQLINEGALDRPTRNDWLGVAVAMATAAARLQHREYAAIVHERLKPHQKHQVVIGYGSYCMGSVSRFLGLCAAGSGDLEAARRYFTQALKSNHYVGAKAGVAHVLADLCRLELYQGDKRRAKASCDESIETASQLGMKRLLWEVNTMRDELGS